MIMRILHTLSQKPEATGSGITIREIIAQSHKKGHENFLFAGISGGETCRFPCYLEENHIFVEFNSENLPYDVAGMSDVMPYKSTKFSDLSEEDIIKYEEAFLEKLIISVERFKPDIIHGHHLWILTGLMKRTFPEIPLIAHCHGTDLRQIQLCPQHRHRVISGCSKVDGVLVLSGAQKEQVVKTYGLSPEIAFLTGTGYNEQIFHNDRKEKKGRIEILYAGKLSRAKGVYWLLEALHKISHFKWHLHMAGSGSGPEKDEILKKSEEMKDKVTWRGQINQKELAELMRLCHIFVLPSFYEGFPLVLIEALASGCRIVVTELPAVTEMKSEKSMPFISTVPLPRLNGPDRPVEEDVPLFVENLKKSLEEQLYLSEEKLRDEEITPLLKYYTWTEVFKRIEQVYEALIVNKRNKFL